MGTHHKALHFPPELYRPIAEQLNGDTTTLLAMSLTSRMTHQEATRVLYRHIVLRNPEQQRQFLHTIINSQSLSDLVYSWMYFISNAPDGPFTCLLSSAVPALQNLKQLGLNGHAIDDELMDHLELATFQLEAFYSNLYFFTRKERLLSWLSSSQRMITTLSLQFAFTWYPGTQAANSVKTLSLSSLVRVYGSRATLASILPFCPTVTEVFWEQHRDDRYTTEINSGLLSSLKQLRKLVFDWRLGLSMLPKIVTYIVNLEVLEVALSYIDVGVNDKFPQCWRCNRAVVPSTTV
ncbi:hypothetical protein AX16_010518 [Volvariella volvacea WC 439]|nr:hypothetical protein AX16_010518 [Volvariella volvacea WC 439]